MQDDIFELARAAICPALIEKLFSCHSSYWENGEFWTLNPLRPDDTAIQSFSISENGLYSDFNTSGGSGDFIDLVSKSQNVSKKKAAEIIIKESGRSLPEQVKTSTKKTKKKKVDPVFPIPEGSLKTLNSVISDLWVVDKWGKAVKGWRYHNESGEVVFSVTRHNTPDGKKNFVPWYFGADGAWHAGHALDSGRPLYNLHKIKTAPKDQIFLGVEGEKCADVEVFGYQLTTHPGGSASIAQADWSPLEAAAKEGRFLYWPDNDEAGRKCAQQVKNRLPGTIILDIPKSKPEKWDIFDAKNEGIDLVEFIKKCSVKKKEKKNDAGEFLCMGYDAQNHYFMRRKIRNLYKIGIGCFNGSKIQSLAPLSFWSIHDMVSDQGAVKVSIAQDYIESLSINAGQYKPERVRGAGVWRDDEALIINNGSFITNSKGDKYSLDDFESDFFYIASGANFPEMSGDISSDSDGRKLHELFKAQEFNSNLSATLALGWSLISLFGGMLKWRPHIWITGKKGSGKSWVLEKLVHAISSEFTHKGSGKDTEAGIRRSLNLDARPVVLDEMEPKSVKDIDKISSILDLARNASSDSSGYITISGLDGGTQKFVIRSCFCFGSIATPDEGAAIASRITKIELKHPKNQKEKFELSNKLYLDCMRDPSAYNRRIFRALLRILSDIEWLRNDYLDIFGDQRRADQIAPMLAAAWAVMSSENLSSSIDGKIWLASLAGEILDDAIIQEDDEDQALEIILAAHIRTDDNDTRTVNELLNLGYCQSVQWAQDELSRYGIKRCKEGLAIACKSEQLKNILKGTPYHSGYGHQIKRHRLCVNERPIQVRMAGGRPLSWVLDWYKFKDEFIDIGKEFDF